MRRMTTLRIGTRGSPLALWQAHFVAGELRAHHAGLDVVLVEIQTTGDQIRDVPLTNLGGEGVFTKAIQNALLDGTVDIAVHSLKDLPTTHVEGLILSAVPPRGPTGDALVSLKYKSFAELPTGAKVATSSLRRRSQILNRRPDLEVLEIRGNVDTRLRKLHEQDLDATILAEAGLQRLGLTDRITEILDEAWMYPAVGQGALGIECREWDIATQELLLPLNDPETQLAVLAERTVLRTLGGGCHVPIGVRGVVRGDRLTLRGTVLSPDGARRIETEHTGFASNGQKMGIDLAYELLLQGAVELLGSTAGGERMPT